MKTPVALLIYLCLLGWGAVKRPRRRETPSERRRHARRDRVPVLPTRLDARIRLAEEDAARLALLSTTLLEVLVRCRVVTPAEIRKLSQEMAPHGGPSSLVADPKGVGR